jgi:hypothetical protein
MILRTKRFLSVFLLGVGLSGCAIPLNFNKSAPIMEGWNFTLLPQHDTELVEDKKRTAIENTQYSEKPPCRKYDDDSATDKTLERCSRDNPTHVAYWTSRPDTFRLACAGESVEYCVTPMIPHCHGFGTSRYCHSHPGGEFSHNHISDLEFASAEPLPNQK